MTEYTGVLATRIDPEAIGLRWPSGERGLLASEQEYAEEDRRIRDAQFEKMPALFAHHGVAIGNWSELCLRLAQAHVAGFKLKKSKQSKEWPAFDEAEFVRDVDALRSADGLSIPEAIKLVIRLDRWKASAGQDTLSGLHTRYKRARQSHAMLITSIQKARLFDEQHAELEALGKTRVQKTKK